MKKTALLVLLLVVAACACGCRVAESHEFSLGCPCHGCCD